MAAMLRRTATVMLIAMAVPATATQPRSELGRLPDGRAVTSLADANARAVVLFFVASDCPISNRTFPEMKRVRAEFESRQVRFWFVYPNLGESANAVKEHQASFDPGGEALLDTDGTLVRLTGARATPEAVILKRASTASQAQ